MRELQIAIIERAAQGKIYQTRYLPSDPLIAVRVNAEKKFGFGKHCGRYWIQMNLSISFRNIQLNIGD